MKMNAQRRLLLLGGIWSCLNGAGVGAISPLLMVFAAHCGLSTQQIAFIGAMRQVVSAPGCLLWSGLADHLKAHKAVLLMLVIAAAGTRTAIFSGRSFPALMGLMLCYRFVSSSVSPLADTIIISGMDEGADYGKVAAWEGVGYAALSALSGFCVDRFGWLSAFIVGASLTLASCLPAAALTFRGKEDRAMQQLQKQQQQAASASASASGEQQSPGGPCQFDDSSSQHSRPGAGLIPLSALRSPLSSRMPPLVSLLAQHGAGSGGCGDRSAHSVEDSTGSLTDMAAVIIQMDAEDNKEDDGTSDTASDSSSSGGHMAVVITLAAAKPSAKPTKPACQEQQAKELLALAQLSRLQKTRLLLQDWRVWLLLWQAFLLGLAAGCNSTFLLLMLRGMGASNLMLGVTTTVERLAQFPAFFLVAPLLRRVRVSTLMHVSLATWVLRLALNALVPLAASPWMTLPIQLLAFDFPWGWSACTITAKQLAPPGLQATMQGLLATSCMCVGTAVGTLVGGQLMGAIGAQWMFVTMAGIMAAALALTAVLDRRSSSTPGPATVASQG